MMTGGILGFLLFAVFIPLLVNETGDLALSLARCVLRWGARRIGQADQAERYEEEWLADLERVPGNLTKLVYACGVLVRSVPRLRWQFRQGSHKARLPGVLSSRIMDTIGEQLAGSLEIDTTLQHVAEMLVPQYADHCFIDLFQGDVLIRRVQQNAADWTPPPGTWAQVGEQIRYPEGHWCQQAMARLDTIIVADVTEDHSPAPSAPSLAASEEVGLTSVLTAPLYARGVLFGVLSLALSGLGNRTDRHYSAADRDLISAVAIRVATAIDDAITVRRAPQQAGPSEISPATS
jgi:transcriptional regulator with GAF, ATPase, and Fis domain